MSVQADASRMCQGRCGVADSGAPEITCASRARVQVSRFTEQLAFISVRCCLSFHFEGKTACQSKPREFGWLQAFERAEFFCFVLILLLFSFACFWLPEETEVLHTAYVNWQHSRVVM